MDEEVVAEGGVKVELVGEGLFSHVVAEALDGGAPIRGELEGEADVSEPPADRGGELTRLLFPPVRSRVPDGEVAPAEAEGEEGSDTQQ